MADSKDDERDEEWFKEVYGKEYTGPVRPASDSNRDNSNPKKRSIVAESDEDEGPPDPNAVPTDFTSREAKVWEAKAKAIERNWKKKKEEELICRICGEYGHFSQGCPSTLGSNRKQGEIVERVPVKDKRLKPRIIGTSGSTIQGIEKDTGCRLKLEDNLVAGNGSFSVRISGNNRAAVGKAVAAVKKLLDQLQDERKPQSLRQSHGSHDRGSSANVFMGGQPQHPYNQRLPHDPSLQTYHGQEGPFGSDQHGNMEQLSQLEARRQWEGGNQNGSYSTGAYGHKGSQFDEGRTNTKEGRMHKEHDRGLDNESGYDHQSLPSTLEALEHRFVQETMQLTKELNDAEDKENARHRELMREIQEQHQQRMSTLRAEQAKRREEFLRREAQLRQQQYQYQQPPSQGNSNYYNYDYNSSTRDQLGYGMGSADRNEGYGGYASFRGEGGYYNNPHSFRSSGYDSGLNSASQAYELGPYRY